MQQMTPEIEDEEDNSEKHQSQDEIDHDAEHIENEHVQQQMSTSQEIINVDELHSPASLPKKEEIKEEENQIDSKVDNKPQNQQESDIIKPEEEDD